MENCCPQGAPVDDVVRFCKSEAVGGFAAEAHALRDVTNAPRIAAAKPKIGGRAPEAPRREVLRKCQHRQTLPFELIATIVAMAGPTDDPSVVLVTGQRRDALRTMLAQQQAAAQSPKRLAPHLGVSELRTRFINWIMTSWWLRTETVFLTVSIIDRHIAHSAAQGRLFGLMAITALAIATKYEEQATPPVADLLAAMDHAYTQQELAGMEAVMLSRLGCQVSMPTAAHLLPAFLEAMWAWTTSSLVGRVSSRIADLAKVASPPATKGTQDSAREDLAWWFAKLALFDVRTVCFAPSKVAASAVLLSNRVHGVRPDWPQAMQRLSGHSQSDLEDCVLLLERHWRSRRC